MSLIIAMPGIIMHQVSYLAINNVIMILEPDIKLDRILERSAILNCECCKYNNDYFVAHS